MSMANCDKCEKTYDTDYEMESIDGEMVCDNCYEEYESKWEPIRTTPSPEAAENRSQQVRNLFANTKHINKLAEHFRQRAAK